MNITVVLEVMVKLFSILILGYALNRLGVLDKNTNIRLSALVSKVTAPLLIIASALTASTENRPQVLLLLAAGFVMYFGFIVFGRFAVWLFRFPKSDRPIYECMLVFSNNAFMGYPVYQELFGTQSVFYASMINFAFNVYIYTYAVGCFSKFSDRPAEGLSLRRLMTPGLILTILALVVYITSFRLNNFIYDTIYMVGNTTSPLSMLVLGSTMAMYPLRESLTDISCYKFSALRLVVLPLITFVICKIIGLSDFYTGLITVSNGMPVAALVLMVANDYGADSRLIIRNIVVTTALSVVSIPCLAGIIGRFL